MDDQGKQLTFTVEEYPQLEGIKVGATMDITCKGRVASADENGVVVSLENCDIETEGAADKELRDMKGETSTSNQEPDVAVDDDF